MVVRIDVNMNQIVEDNVDNRKCSKKGTNSKNKKKLKDTTDELNLDKEHLSESLSRDLHINNVHHNLTNGTSELVKDFHDPDLGKPNCTQEHAQVGEEGDANKNLNNLKLYNHRDEGCSEEKCTSQFHLVRNLVEQALGNLESALSLQEKPCHEDIDIISYESELQMPEIMRLIQKDLSEPYSIYTYRYFIHNWPKLCFLAIHDGKCIGAIVCKLDLHRNVVKRGYIAMLAVDEKYRKKKIGSSLVRKAIQAMITDNADEVVLETEITNKPALKLYENLGFVRDKRLFRYYLNGVDALRLKLWLR